MNRKQKRIVWTLAVLLSGLSIVAGVLYQGRYGGLRAAGVALLFGLPVLLLGVSAFLSARATASEPETVSPRPPSNVDQGLKRLGVLLGIIVGLGAGTVGVILAWDMYYNYEAEWVPMLAFGGAGLVAGFIVVWLFLVGVRWVIRGFRPPPGEAKGGAGVGGVHEG